MEKNKTGQLKLNFYSLDDYKATKKIIEKSELSMQEFMTLTAIKILNDTEIKEKNKETPIADLQFRLDKTLHNLLKIKAKQLNKSISELYRDYLLKDKQ
jgi:predicted HicB family RNase H-like nuclease